MKKKRKMTGMKKRTMTGKKIKNGRMKKMKSLMKKSSFKTGGALR